MNCALCGHKILESDSRSNFTEGVFCADGAGCRRRALHLREALRRCGELAMSRKTGAIKHLVKKTLNVEHFEKIT